MAGKERKLFVFGELESVVGKIAGNEDRDPRKAHGDLPAVNDRAKAVKNAGEVEQCYDKENNSGGLVKRVLLHSRYA